MATEATIIHDSANYNAAVQTIKEAILRSQYQAAKLVNRDIIEFGSIGHRLFPCRTNDGTNGTMRNNSVMIVERCGTMCRW